MPETKQPFDVKGYRPDMSKMYGLTHDTSGNQIQREVRFMKVGFGVPTGPDIHVRLNGGEKPWRIEIGRYETVNGKNKRVETVAKDFVTKAEAHKYYKAQREVVPLRPAPRKFPYFTFLKIGLDGFYQHDFDAIEAQGPCPQEVEVVLMNENAFERSYQYWTKSHLVCEGNGIDARRRIEPGLIAGPEENKMADLARAAGEKFFPVLGGCATYGCRFIQEDANGKTFCKPHGRLYFQLTRSLRIGASCSYDTTGKQSISRLETSTSVIRAFTGSIAGIRLVFTLRPYRSEHNGQSSIQYAVNLEYRGEPTGDAVDLVSSLRQGTQAFAQARHGGPLQLEDGLSVAEVDEVQSENPQLYEDEEEEAAVLDAEFYGDFQNDDDSDGVDDEGAPSVVTKPAGPAVEMPKRKEPNNGK